MSGQDDADHVELASLLLGLGHADADASPPKGPHSSKRKYLTQKGSEKLFHGDTRVRTYKIYASLFAPDKLPEFRLISVEAAAHAEDCVMVWAYVSRQGECVYSAVSIEAYIDID